MNEFTDRTIVLGVGGGIAAYKACEVARLFVKGGARVRVAMTRAATHFVAPLTLQALTSTPVLVDVLAPEQDQSYGHLGVARGADLMVIAPATADLIARLRAGMGDDAVTTVALACQAPFLVAPAMNTRMWESVAVRENVAALARRGWHQVGPGSGVLADGDVGPGRLAEPEEIVDAAARLLRPRDLAGRRVVVTAGPTREPIDPVRFISNPSSGRMGFAVARAAARRGAEVVLVTGPVELADVPGARTIRVTTAEEMARAVDEETDRGFDLFVGAAAVSDFRPRTAETSKKKKGTADEQLVLTRTRDILAGLGERHAGHATSPVLVGFAAETDSVLEHARQKLVAKRCDLVVANDVRKPGAGFATETNHVTLVTASGQVEVAASKDAVAEAILDQVAPVLQHRRPRT